MAEELNSKAAEPKKSKSGIFIIVGAVLVLRGGGGGAAWYFLRSNPAATDAKPATKKEKEIKAVLHLEGFVVNLADSEENRFLRAGIDLGVGKELGGGHGEKTPLPTAAVRDAILGELSKWTSEALLAPDGKTKLKEQLLKRLQENIPELDVKEIYFTDFLVQR